MAGNDDADRDRYEAGRAPVQKIDDEKRSADPHPTAELPPVGGVGTQVRESSDDEPGAAPAAPDRTPGALRGLFWLVGIAGVILALLWGLHSVGFWPHLTNPFAGKKTDRSQPVLLKSIKDLNRFVAAEGNFQVVSDLQNNRKYIPDFLVNDRVLFVAAGSVEAYVDFSTIGQGAITESADHKTVTIKLPAPALGKPNIDHERSYVFAEQKGILNRLNDLVNADPNKEQPLYQLAEQRIADAAKDTELLQRAQANTGKMLEQMLRSLGYTNITIEFAQP